MTSWSFVEVGAILVITVPMSILHGHSHNTHNACHSSFIAFPISVLLTDAHNSICYVIREFVSRPYFTVGCVTIHQAL